MENRTPVRDRINKIKNHFKENKTTYLACGGTAVVAVVGTIVAMSAMSDKGSGNASQKIGNLNWHPIQVLDNTVTYQMPARGHRGNMIVDNETRTPYASQNAAAKALDLDASDLSRHLQGRKPHVKGHTFTNLGENMKDEVTLAA
jgi:hypothetical protein